MKAIKIKDIEGKEVWISFDEINKAYNDCFIIKTETFQIQPFINNIPTYQEPVIVPHTYPTWPQPCPWPTNPIITCDSTDKTVLRQESSEDNFLGYGRKK